MIHDGRNPPIRIGAGHMHACGCSAALGADFRGRDGALNSGSFAKCLLQSKASTKKSELVLRDAISDPVGRPGDQWSSPKAQPGGQRDTRRP